MKGPWKGIAVAAAAALIASLQAPATAQMELAPPQRQAPAPAPTLLEMLVATASAGNVEAMNNLAVLLTMGALVPRDYGMALYWYQKAIDGGSPDAMNNLGAMYLYELGLQRDYANAFLWFGRAAKRGNVHGMYSAAALVEAGLGTSRNPRLACVLFRKAAESGFVPAMVKFSDDFAQSTGASADLIEAYAWLQVASQSGLPEGTQIAALAKIDALGARIGARRRDEARMRAAQLASGICENASAVAREHVLPAQMDARFASARSTVM